MFEIPQWPYFLGEPQAVGVLRSCPEDFVVEEIPKVLPVGEGAHLWLWVEKRSANTDWVAQQLARAVKCPARDVGFAGLKDRHAVTRQWFSIPCGDATQQGIESVQIEGVKILESHRHSRKLKRGVLSGNRFCLTVRNLDGDTGHINQRLEEIRNCGVPNYFGPQRFGQQGQNVERGFNLLKKQARMQRNKRSIYLSALRSFLFNHVLAERVRREVWNTVIDGELAMLDGTQSIFHCEHADADIEDRCSRLDIHPTGPLPGENGTRPSAEAAELEQAVLQHWPELIGVLEEQRVKAARRALRLYPADLEWEIRGSMLELGFVLPPGAYATTVLREVLIT